MGSQRVASEIVIYDDIEEPESETSNGTSSIDGNDNKDNELQNKTSDGLDAAVEGLNENANPVFSNLSKILTKFGLEENKDFTQDQLKQKHSLEDYYNADAIALLRQSSGSTESANPQHSNRLRYWYHPNYLGNVDMITDLNGEVNQYYVYSPFGENIYDWSTNTLWNTPYRFNGKELDPETGNQYYGARYYDPKISVWLSVDPWVHKYPKHSPYNFVFNNPMHFTDPTGLGPEKEGGGFGEKLGNWWSGNGFKSDEDVELLKNAKELDEIVLIDPNTEGEICSGCAKAKKIYGNGVHLFGSGSNGVDNWNSGLNPMFSIDMADDFWGAFFGFGQKSLKRKVTSWNDKPKDIAKLYKKLYKLKKLTFDEYLQLEEYENTPVARVPEAPGRDLEADTTYQVNHQTKGGGWIQKDRTTTKAKYDSIKKLYPAIQIMESRK